MLVPIPPFQNRTTLRIESFYRQSPCREFVHGIMNIQGRPVVSTGRPLQKKTGAMTTVSVIIPVRNAARWLGEAIDSVLRQTMPAQEIIVVDNASVDDTCAVFEQVRSAAPAIGLVRNLRYLGPAASRNIGIDPDPL